MKAYKVYDPTHYEGYQDVVFAATAKEAKKIGFSTSECFEDSEWINVRVNRVPYLDGLENRTREEILYVALLNGWWYEVGDTRYDEENIEEAIKNGIVKPLEREG